MTKENQQSKILHFVIEGNHESKRGNPVPYVRSTRGAQWTGTNKRYHRWCEYVRACFLDKYPETTFKANTLLHRKPIILGMSEWAKLDILITWGSRRHGDPDNVWKGVCDALFANDKEVYGRFERHNGGLPRIDVQLSIHRFYG